MAATLEEDRIAVESAFKEVAREAGFELKRLRAYRRAGDVHQLMLLSVGRFAPWYSVDMWVRVVQEGDPDTSKVQGWHIGASVQDRAREKGAKWFEFADLEQPIDTEVRKAVLASFIREYGVTWFPLVQDKETVLRLAVDSDLQRQLNAIVFRQLHDDYDIPL